MVAIRLRRAGSKKRPFFRVVVTDSRTARDSSFVEILGHYNPRSKPAVVTVDKERVDYWLKKGAQPSDSVNARRAANQRPGERARGHTQERQMVVIRLRRAGSKKRPFFRVVVTDSRAARDSSFVEILGHYNPRTKPAIVQVNRERVDYWISKGAQPSDSVRTLIARHLTPAPPAAEPAPKAV